MKVLVTGGNGFLGSWMVKGLVAKGYEVKVLHRPTSDLKLLKDIPFQSCLGDITEPDQVLEACRNVDVVFHIAGLISYNRHDHSRMENVNVKGTQIVVDACLKAKVKRLIHTSSVVAIGGSFKENILNETSPYTLEKYNFGYYETKRRAENVVLSAFKNEKLDAVILNPGTMFGPGDFTKASRKIHLKVVKGRFPFYPPGGLSILHVEDAVTAHINAIEKGLPGERYILGGDNMKTKEMFALLAKCGNHSPPQVAIPAFILKAAYSAGAKLNFNTDTFLISTLFHWYDSSKAKSALGFNPRPAAMAISESVRYALDCKSATAF